jgi:hypothetical protein
MPLTLSTLDEAYAAADAESVTKALAGLDGKRNLIATLARGESTYLQATGSASSGLTLTYQDGSLERRYRSVDKTLPLPRVTEAFHQYLHGDESWRANLQWERDEEKLEVTTWYESWWFYIGALIAVIALFVWWRGW